MERLLPAGEDLLLVAKGGSLHRFNGTARPPTLVLDSGKDYDIREGLLVRLERERIVFFRLGPDHPPRLERALPGATHDLSVALSDRALYLHSPGNPANVLVVERERETGRWNTGYLPVERSVMALLVRDLDRILEDTGYVRALRRGFVFVPLIRDPIEIVGTRRTTLFLSSGDRGTIRTVSQRVALDGGSCPACPRREYVETWQEIRRLYVDVAVEASALWILRLDPPGSARSILYRFPLASSRPEARSWSLPWEGQPPRAMAVWRDQIVIGGDGHLDFYAVPAIESGIPCVDAS